MFEKKSAFGVIGTILRTLFFALIAAIALFLGWRMLNHNTDPAELMTLTPNEALSAAYAAHGEALTLYRQEQGSYTRAERNNGYFFIRQATFIPQAEQVQILFRYNNSTIDALVKDYGLAATPDRGEHLYDLSIVIKRDLTPDIADDADTEGCYTLERYHPTDTVSGERNLYNYRRAVFDGIVVDDTTLGVFVDIYYVGDIDYEKPAYGTLCIWDFSSEDLPVKLTERDVEALEQ